MNYTEDNAIDFINEFFMKMHEWGIRLIFLYKSENGGPQKNQELMRNELRLIYDDFLTKKDRKTGRLESMAVSIGSPDYDPVIEKAIDIERMSSGFVIFTKKDYVDDDYFEIQICDKNNKRWS